MRVRIRRLSVLTKVLLLSTLLLACGGRNGYGHVGLVDFERLVANPQLYTGRYVCTGGIHADGFEVSGLGASIYEKDGYPQLIEPVIWLEGAHFQSRQNCTRTDTQPPFEFCKAVVCGVFETGGGYGPAGACAYQLLGRGVPALACVTPPAMNPIQSDVNPIP